MPTFYDSQNNAYRLTEQIGRGGEGTVFACEDFETVAKIYHEAVSPEKAEKLLWMARNNNEHLLKVAAWVVDVLRDAPDGKIVGFLMPNVKAKEIHELYSLKSRRVHFPQATWHFLTHTAANVARAFYSLHKDSHVMGDVNHGNCVVLNDGTVKLIDCDSYSIKNGKGRYICDVGVATHLAPELQGVDLNKVLREEKHDNFGLAVIIFQLLFLGRHPFAGIYAGAEDKPLEDCIREYLFAYGKGAEVRGVRQPPGTLMLAEVSPRVAELFERAFLTNDERPNPREWIEALEDLSNNLEQCAAHSGHQYFRELAKCPWCRIESQTGVMLFPFVSSDANANEPFNIFTIENLIANLGISSNLPAKPQVGLLPPPSPEVVNVQNATLHRHIKIIAAQFVGLAFLMFAFGVGAALFIGVISMIALIIVVNNFDRKLRTEINEKLFNSRLEWQELEKDWQQAFVPEKLRDDIERIREKVKSYALQPENRRRTVEREIEALLSSVHTGAALVKNRQQTALAKSEKLAGELAQTESDANALGSNSWAIVVLLLITFFPPMLVGSFMAASRPPAPVPSYQSNYPDGSKVRPEPLREFTHSVSADGIIIDDSLPANVTVDENLNEREIQELLTATYRVRYADILHVQASDLIYNGGKSSVAERKKALEKAEKKMRLAVRLDASKKNYKQLGFVLYEQKRYADSLDVLNKSLTYDGDDTEVEIIIGMNYLQMKRYDDARQLFDKIVETDEDSFAGYFNLGLAHSGLKNYQAAVSAFDKAVKIDPTDAEAQYELGMSLYNSGSIEGAKSQYRVLREIDRDMAEKLRANANLF